MLKNSTQPAGGGNVMYPGKVPGKVKYTFAFGALGKDMIYGMIATFSMIYFQPTSLRFAPGIYRHHVLLPQKSGTPSTTCLWECWWTTPEAVSESLSVAGSRNTDQRICFYHFVHRLPSERHRTLRICCRCLYPLGHDLYHYGYFRIGLSFRI